MPHVGVTLGGRLRQQLRWITVIRLFQGLCRGLEITSTTTVVHIPVKIPAQAIFIDGGYGAHGASAGDDKDRDERVDRHNTPLQSRAEPRYP